MSERYGTGRILIEEGFYSRADIQAMLEWFSRTDKALQESMRPVKTDDKGIRIADVPTSTHILSR